MSDGFSVEKLEALETCLLGRVLRIVWDSWIYT